MSDLGLYHRNVELEAQVASLQRDLHKTAATELALAESKALVAELTARLGLEVRYKSKYKRKAERLQAKYEKPAPSRHEQARGLVRRRIAGEKIRLVDIAAQCFLSNESVKGISHRLRNEQKNLAQQPPA